MTIQQELELLRKEIRYLRVRVPQLEKAWEAQKKINKEQAKIISLQKKQIKQLEKENKELKDKLDSTTNHKNKLAGIIFKPNTKKNKKNAKKRGAQKGHKAHKRARKTPTEFKRCYLTNCPHCGEKVKRSTRVYKRVVEDIPQAQSATVTEYTIEKQRCTHCKKDISATPHNAVPYSPLGTNLIILILTLKYNFRLPLNRIQEFLETQHNLHISQGTMQNILKRTQDYFGDEYERILKRVRGAPTKHADETSWRTEGQNSWAWLFATEKEALYTIEETRGKGVPQKILSKIPQGVLVRDDYGAYKHLDMEQQSCWTHLLRVSRDAESKEAKRLHNTLKSIFAELKEILDTPFDKDEREYQYQVYTQKIQNIINTEYTQKDTIKIQTRIKNQNGNLLTALLHENVPLTNNHAERQIRPLAVQRKISGGSRSALGAKIHAVNMSIVQTLKLRGENLIDGLHALLDHSKFVVENCE